jgi:predicted dehydrogenase
MNDYKISVWGLGNHAFKRILPTILHLKEFTLIGVCSRSKNNVEACAREYSCDGWTDPAAMLNNTMIDFIYISTPIGVHYDMASKALRASKNVWCEKPLTCNFNHTKKLIDLAKNNKKMLVEAFMFFYHPQYKRIQKLLKYKEIGEVHSVICRFGIPALEVPGFRENADLGGGAFWDVGSYTVAAVLGLFENQNVAILFSEIIKDNNSPVDRSGRAVLKFSKGTIAYLEWGIGVAYKNDIDLWAENGSFYTDKIFSKPENYLPIYRIRNKYGDETILKGEQSEQFREMFSVFSNISNSIDQTYEEYKRIYRRAQVMDEILKFSQKNKLTSR